jgi:hypothetical protein
MVVVTSAEALRGVRANRPTPVPLADLEAFWPSRRYSAFDELCR